MEIQEMEQEQLQQNQQEKNSQPEKRARIFVIKLSLYVLFGLFVPLIFLIWRFELFSSTRNTVGVWGVVTVIVTAVFLSILANQAEQCIDSQQGKQIISAIRKVFIPLLATALIFWGLSSFFKELVQLFVVLAFSETIASIINPFPQYIKEKEEENKDQKDESKFLKFAKLFWKAKE